MGACTDTQTFRRAGTLMSSDHLLLLLPSNMTGVAKACHAFFRKSNKQEVTTNIMKCQ